MNDGETGGGGLGAWLEGAAEVVESAADIARGGRDIVDTIGGGGGGGGGGMIPPDAGPGIIPGGAGGFDPPPVEDWELGLSELEKEEESLTKFAETALTLDSGTIAQIIAGLPVAGEVMRFLGELLGIGAAASTNVPAASITIGTAEVYAVEVARHSPDLYRAMQLTRQQVDLPLGMTEDVAKAWQAMQVLISGTYVAPWGCDPASHCEQRTEHWRHARNKPSLPVAVDDGRQIGRRRRLLG